MEVRMPFDRPQPVLAVVGSLNIDLVAYTSRVPAAGETVLGDRFVMGFGGKGANQAVMAARLGARVSMVGALGDDVYAGMTFDNLAAQGVDATHVARVSGSSGVAPIWVEPDGTNRIIVVGGANDAVDPEAAAAAVRSLRPAVVVGQLEIPQTATTAGFESARSVGAVTILNPAPAATLEPALLAGADWLIPNESELAMLAGLDRFDPSDDAALLAYAARIEPRLVMTLGARGAALVAADARSVERIPAIRVTPVDTTGAGDAFVGAFAYGLAAGLDEVMAIRLGIACASDSVTRTGTQSSFATRAVAKQIVEGVLAAG
jgi:ribokinase